MQKYERFFFNEKNGNRLILLNDNYLYDSILLLPIN